MSLSQLLNQPCTLIKRHPSAETDRYGDPIPSETAVETVCEIQQRQRGEEGDQELGREQWLGIFLPGTDLEGIDAVITDQGEFELDGPPWPARNPRTQAESHVEATLIQVRGEERVS